MTFHCSIGKRRGRGGCVPMLVVEEEKEGVKSRVGLMRE